MSTLTLDFAGGTDALSRLLAPDSLAEIQPPPAGSLYREHVHDKVTINLSWVVDWLRTIHLLRRCPANNLPLAKCAECREGMKKLRHDPESIPRLARGDLLTSRFVGGSSNRPGPHLHEMGEAIMANLLQAAGISALA